MDFKFVDGLGAIKVYTPDNAIVEYVISPSEKMPLTYRIQHLLHTWSWRRPHIHLEER